jgi:tetratricopeptide (TPR) repeat protein
LIEEVKHKWKNVEKVTAFVLAVIIILLTATAYARNGVWENGVCLWTDVVNKSPDKARPYNNLGKAFNEKGRTDEAIENYKKALSLSPGFAEAQFNLGNSYKDIGDMINAEKAWKKTLEIKPSHSLALNQLGNVSYYRGMFQEAKKYYTASLEMDSMHAKAHYNLAFTLEKLNDPTGAIRHYKLFIKTSMSEHHDLIPEVRKRISMLSFRP